MSTREISAHGLLSQECIFASSWCWQSESSKYGPTQTVLYGHVGCTCTSLEGCITSVFLILWKMFCSVVQRRSITGASFPTYHWRQMSRWAVFLEERGWVGSCLRMCYLVLEGWCTGLKFFYYFSYKSIPADRKSSTFPLLIHVVEYHTGGPDFLCLHVLFWKVRLESYSNENGQ